MPTKRECKDIFTRKDGRILCQRYDNGTVIFEGLVLTSQEVLEILQWLINNFYKMEVNFKC